VTGGSSSPGAPVRVAVVTISDGVAAGVRVDRSGATIVDWVRDRGYQLVSHAVVPDQADRITAVLVEASNGAADLVLTTGGTGLAPRDITPEATQPLLERAAPGIAERIRAAGLGHTPYAALSRGLAGVRGSTLIVNLPGSTGGVRDGLRVLGELVGHAVQLLRGVDTQRHDPPNA
jgi:molybdenum cofactor synthesis domain-containing protein